MITIEKMIQEDKTNCVGCYGCYNICPKKAIVMEEDEEGFRYPIVQQEMCIQCEACSRVSVSYTHLTLPTICSV